MACLNAEFVTAQFVIPVCPYIFLVMIVTLSLKMSLFFVVASELTKYLILAVWWG